MRVRLYQPSKTKLSHGQMRTTFKAQRKVKLSGIPGESGGEAEFRLLEDGFIRITENDDLRILE